MIYSSTTISIYTQKSKISLNFFIKNKALLLIFVFKIKLLINKKTNDKKDIFLKFPKILL